MTLNQPILQKSIGKRRFLLEVLGD
jgi:hypothetical protein